LEQALSRRRSQRQFARDNLTIGQVGQILWATQGITSPQGFRTAPSAGATYPLDIYVLWSGRAARYDSSRHRLDIVYDQDRQPQVAETTIQPEIILAAPVVFIIVGVYERTAGRYGRERAGRYVCMEAGHAAQNLLLQASALGLGGVTIGAFDDERLSTAMELPLGHSPLYVIPIGRPA
jgi:SagB-type dehydrogenase family enzyme